MIAINSSLYQQLLADINAVILQSERIVISIYSDENGSQFVNDTNGHPIDAQKFTSISYQYPTDLEDGSLTINFDDGCSINIHDNTDNYYYNVAGVTNGIAPLK